MAIIDWVKDETVAIIRMNNGANQQNLEFATGLCNAIDEAVADAEVSAIILTSTDPKSFSQGVDIGWMMGRLGESDFDAMKAFMYKMNEAFMKLFTVPVPTIAAINGHAFGNGAILSCACDFRLMRKDRGYFCFPEVDLGIPFLPGMIAFCRKSIPEWKFNELKLTGKRATGDELAASHIAIQVSEGEEGLMADSLAFARTFLKKRGIFGEHKKRMHKEIREIMETEDTPFIESLELFIQE